MAKKKPFSEVKAYLEQHGVTCLTTEEDYVNTRGPLTFVCKICGKPYKSTFMHIVRSPSYEFKCDLCNRQAKPSWKNDILPFFNSFGVTPEPTDYKNSKTKIYYSCPNCKKRTFVTWASIRDGRKNLLCHDCGHKGSPSLEYLNDLAESQGSKLLSTEYKDAFSWLYYSCSDCGVPFHNTWANIQMGKNKHYRCKRCIQLNRVKPDAEGQGRETYQGGKHWYSLIALFFNVKSDNGISDMKHEFYSSHHVYPYHLYPELKGSLTNGYPIPKDLHMDYGSVDYRILHEKVFDPDLWNGFAESNSQLFNRLKLPFHNYPNFRFWDLTKFLVTETFIEDDDQTQNTITEHEQYWSNQGIIYVPVSWKTYAYSPDRASFFNFIRDLLRPFIPEIDYYTGAKRFISGNKDSEEDFKRCFNK